ncbi:MAG TPA: adaptor protein MecA, partial [Lysinibacillus sp.]|nr:adaptor protein MecA [Lysinibacillus sp.]
MDIERVNENTLKLFITYNDIEDRGYSREEIWYNRAKGEQLFWDMIDEVNTEDYFDVEGPIW